jgi:hypothetical protein
VYICVYPRLIFILRAFLCFSWLLPRGQSTLNRTRPLQYILRIGNPNARPARRPEFATAQLERDAIAA